MKFPQFSTTKLVFIIIACSVVVFTHTGKIDPKDFFGLAMVVFYHYYNKPKDVQKETVELG